VAVSAAIRELRGYRSPFPFFGCGSAALRHLWNLRIAVVSPF
jgi:hypothetical protein